VVRTRGGPTFLFQWVTRKGVSDVPTSLLSTVVMSQKVWHKLNFVQDGIAYTYGQLNMYIMFMGVQLKLKLELDWPQDG
jgi:hypothetical protein